MMVVHLGHRTAPRRTLHVFPTGDDGLEGKFRQNAGVAIGVYCTSTMYATTTLRDRTSLIGQGALVGG